MPSGNKTSSEFKGFKARKLASDFNLPPEAFSHYFRNGANNTINYDDVSWLVDQIHYDTHGTHKINPYNIILDKRFDTDLVAYTKKQFIDFYGLTNHISHWERAPYILQTPI